ncbi:MAG TPA: choice-of-anchor D domain-containing protein [Solirubrobacter sp.]|nr:choice-of-anchor D domain-containing protein [Solirubrobacter sp.]
MAMLAVTVACGWTATADAYVYWVGTGGDSVGRANLDGTEVNPSLISGLRDPSNLTVRGGHVYWANAIDSVGRGVVDGTGKKNDFMSALHPFGIEVDDRHIYWSSLLTRTIGRANLDGSDANPSFIDAGQRIESLVVDGEYIYWTVLSPSVIGRAKLDGTEIEPRFIAVDNYPRGIAVTDEYIYWGNIGGRRIGRARLDGSDVDQALINVDMVQDVAVDDRYVYWADTENRRIGRANLDGSDVDQNFISTIDAPSGVAIDDGPAGRALASSGSLTFGPYTPGPKSLTITNEGHGKLAIESASIAGPDAEDFAVSGDDCSGRRVHPGKSCRIEVRFTPSTTGTREATLIVASNERGSPLEIDLRGTASPPPRPAPTAATEPAPSSPAPTTPASTPAPSTPPAADVLLRICSTAKHRRRCATRQVIGRKPVLPATAARASLTRGRKLYATGTARAKRLTLKARKRVPAGRYTLTLRFRHEGRQTMARTRIAIR